MATFDELQKAFNKQYGENVAQSGDTLIESGRIPTGIFPLDMIIGGGIPRGRVTEFFGLESTCKSNVAYKLLASHQKLFPDLKNALIDIENSYTPMWFRRMGGEPKDLLVLKPDYGEQVVDMTEALIRSPDCGAVLLDSLAATVTTREAENSAEKADPGGSAMVGKKLMNKVTMAQRHVEADGLYPTFIYINQLKFKIGVLYGNPETTPGGNSPKFASALRLRFYAKDIREDKWSTTHACRKEIHVVVVKHKVPIVARECVFTMAMIPHAGMDVGDIDDWSSVWFYLQKHGLAEKTSSGIVLAGKTYKSQTELREYLAEDFETAHSLKQSMIQAEVAAAYNAQHVGKAKEKA